VAERIREEVGLLLQKRIKDPALEPATVTEVTVTADLRCACIRYSVLGGEEERRAAAEGWRRGAGFIRREVARALGLRFAPALSFRYDDGLERADRVRALLAETRKE